MKKIVSMVSCLLTLFVFSAQAQETPEMKLEKAEFSLPKPVLPLGNYVSWRRAGNILYLSGHGACEGENVLGKVGADLTVQQGYEAAQRVGLCMLSTIKMVVGELSNIKQVLQINGMVNASEDFTGHSTVINGVSDLFVVAFGEEGKAARTAAGMSSLPGNMAVEINAVLEVK